MKAGLHGSLRSQSGSSQMMVSSGGLILDPDAAKMARKQLLEKRRKAKDRLDVDLLESFMLGFSSGA